MWRIVSIRRSYYTTDEVLVWVRDMNALLSLMDAMGWSACTSHYFTP